MQEKKNHLHMSRDQNLNKWLLAGHKLQDYASILSKEAFNSCIHAKGQIENIEFMKILTSFCRYKGKVKIEERTRNPMPNAPLLLLSE